MASVSLKNINKKWQSIYGVKDYNLEVNDREFIVFLGPSGCGKTTTLRMIAGLEDPSSGEIFIDDILVNNLEPKDRNIAMVFQNYGLYPHLSVYDNICFPLKVRKIPKESHDKRIRKAAAMVELESLLSRKPKELSGGQRQRVALARAIVREPKVFLMDEPLSNLDAKLRISTRAQLKNLQHELQVTTIYVTHDQIEAMTLADRIVVMDKGEIQQIGSPIEIYNNPTNIFVAGFIGSPPMNIVKGEIHDGVFNSDGMRIEGLQKNISEAVYLGFRAEDSELASDSKSSQLSSSIFSYELLGNCTMLSIKIQNTLVSIKASKNFKAAIGDIVNIHIPVSSCHIFDMQTGKRKLA